MQRIVSGRAKKKHVEQLEEHDADSTPPGCLGDRGLTVTRRVQRCLLLLGSTGGHVARRAQSCLLLLLESTGGHRVQRRPLLGSTGGCLLVVHVARVELVLLLEMMRLVLKAHFWLRGLWLAHQQ